MVKQHSGYEQGDGLTAVVEREKADLYLDGELKPSDYVQDIAASPEIVSDVNAWLVRKQENTRTNITMWLMGFFGSTLAATFILIGAAAFNQNADRVLVKDLTSMVITAQAGLLGTTLGYYFGAKEK